MGSLIYMDAEELIHLTSSVRTWRTLKYKHCGKEYSTICGLVATRRGGCLLLPIGNQYSTFDSLASAVGWRLEQEKTMEVWKVDRGKVENAKGRYHGAVTPMG